MREILYPTNRTARKKKKAGKIKRSNYQRYLRRKLLITEETL